LAGAFALSASLPFEYTQPELILYNWNIITAKDRQPRLKQSRSQGIAFWRSG